jgi:hypothetical protein
MENAMTPNSQSSLPLVAKLGLIGALGAAAIYAARQRRRMDFAGKTVLISGASRGLGRNWPALLQMKAPISCFLPGTQTS